jgi:hypothetical protein
MIDLRTETLLLLARATRLISPACPGRRFHVISTRWRRIRDSVRGVRPEAVRPGSRQVTDHEDRRRLPATLAAGRRATPAEHRPIRTDPPPAPSAVPGARSGHAVDLLPRPPPCCEPVGRVRLASSRTTKTEAGRGHRPDNLGRCDETPGWSSRGLGIRTLLGRSGG